MIDKETEPVLTQDEQLAASFALLRAEEAPSAPEFTREKRLRQQGPVRTQRRFTRQALPPVAAAVALVAVGAVLLSQQSEDDPAALYASIMSQQSLQTDSLLQVSESVLPALSDVPDLYQIDEMFQPETLNN